MSSGEDLCDGHLGLDQAKRRRSEQDESRGAGTNKKPRQSEGSSPELDKRGSSTEELELVRESSRSSCGSGPATPSLRRRAARTSSMERTSSTKSLELVLSLSSQESNDSDGPAYLSSQDSLYSEPDQDTFTISEISSDPVRQKTCLAHKISAQRRLARHRLDVGPGSLPPVNNPGKEVEAKPLSSLNCMDIWFCLETEEEIRDLDRQYDQGWLEACRLLVKFVTPERFPQAAAQHKFLTEAVQRHGERLVRETAYCSLLHCLATHSPGKSSVSKRLYSNYLGLGPKNPTLTAVYLEMLSFSTPYVKNWKFSNTEPWDFLRDVLEKSINESFTEENSNQDEKSGNVLVLQFLGQVCQSDLEQLLDVSMTQDQVRTDYKPLLGRVLCPSEAVGWSKRMQQLCQYYRRAVAGNCAALSPIRRLIGLSAQMISFKERSGKSNSDKTEMANFLASQLKMLELGTSELWAQIFLLEPSWLSSMVSREMLSSITNIKLPSNGLRPLINNFVETNMELRYFSSPALTSTPRKKKNNNNKVSGSTYSQSPIAGGVKLMSLTDQAKTARDVANTEEGLEKVERNEEEDDQVSKSQFLSNQNYKALLELAITKYCGAHSITDFKRIFRTFSLEELMSANEKECNRQFGNQNELIRGENMVIEDLKDFEKLLLNRREISEDYPLSKLMLNFAVSK